MLTTIDFDNQASFEADKVDNVTTHRNLSSKLQTRTLPIPEGLPKPTFHIGLMSSQMAGAALRLIFVSPLTLPHAFGMRAPPSPTRGEGFFRHRT